MKERIIKPYVFMGIFLILMGISLFVVDAPQFKFISITVSLVLLISGIFQWLSTYRRRTENLCRQSCTLSLWLASFQVLFAVLMIIFIQQSLLWMTIIIGLYQLFFAMISSYSLYLNYKDRAKIVGITVFNAMLHWIFAGLSLFGENKVEHTLWRLGVYLVLLGINYLWDAVKGGYRHLFHYRHRPLRIPLPLIMTLLMPYQLLIRLQTYLEKDRFRELLIKEFIEGKQTEVEILIHTGYSLFDRVGHIDVAYKGVVYSFGNHDADSRRLFDLLGKGIVLKVNRDEYIHMLNRHHVTVISFGLNLSPRQLESFERQLEYIMSQTQETKLTSTYQQKGFIDRLMANSNATFYQFTHGQFQTYFVFGVNCVLFVDYLLWKSDMDMMVLSGVMTPGIYYDYLNREYQNFNSRVVSRKIYNYDLREHVKQFEMKK